MRKLYRHSRILAIVLTSVILVTLLSPTLGNQSSTALASHGTQGLGAATISKFDCQINPGDSGLPITLHTTRSHGVMTPSGISSYHCFFDIPEEYIPEDAYVNRGFLCGTLVGLDIYTTSSIAVVSPGGTVYMSCRITGNYLVSPRTLPLPDWFFEGKPWFKEHSTDGDSVRQGNNGNGQGSNGNGQGSNKPESMTYVDTEDQTSTPPPTSDQAGSDGPGNSVNAHNNQGNNGNGGGQPAVPPGQDKKPDQNTPPGQQKKGG